MLRVFASAFCTYLIFMATVTAWEEIPQTHIILESIQEKHIFVISGTEGPCVINITSIHDHITHGQQHPIRFQLHKKWTTLCANDTYFLQKRNRISQHQSKSTGYIPEGEICQRLQSAAIVCIFFPGRENWKGQWGLITFASIIVQKIRFTSIFCHEMRWKTNAFD